MNKIPRRTYVKQWTPAEKAIKDAMQAVEGVGAHPLLTDAVVLLQAAFEKLADYNDSVIEKAEKCWKKSVVNSQTPIMLPILTVGDAVEAE